MPVPTVTPHWDQCRLLGSHSIGDTWVPHWGQRQPPVSQPTGTIPALWGHAGAPWRHPGTLLGTLPAPGVTLHGDPLGTPGHPWGLNANPWGQTPWGHPGTPLGPLPTPPASPPPTGTPGLYWGHPNTPWGHCRPPGSLSPGDTWVPPPIHSQFFPCGCQSPPRCPLPPEVPASPFGSPPLPWGPPRCAFSAPQRRCPLCTNPCLVNTGRCT